MRTLVGLAVVASFAGCVGPRTSDHAYSRAFGAGLRQYVKAGEHQTDLAKPVGPVSNVRLFSRYAKVFYLPRELEPLISEKGAVFLRSVSRSGSPDARALAGICLDIHGSERKLRRDGQIQKFRPFRATFILYHYD